SGRRPACRCYEHPLALNPTTGCSSTPLRATPRCPCLMSKKPTPRHSVIARTAASNVDGGRSENTRLRAPAEPPGDALDQAARPSGVESVLQYIGRQLPREWQPDAAVYAVDPWAPSR